MSAISARRIWLVARRDYFGYVKTWGFWISFFLPFIFGALGFFASASGLDFTSTQYETVIDETGEGVGAALVADYYARLEEVRQAALEELPEAARERADDAMREQAAKDIVFIDSPAPTLEALQPWLEGERQLTIDGEDKKLHGVLQIFERDGRVEARYWTPNVNANRVSRIAERYFRERAQADYLATGGLTPEGLEEASGSVPVQTFDPNKIATDDDEDQQVTLTDRLPYFVAAGAAAFLWFTVFSGAYMLLTSMLEEKLGKLMEMMLATTRFVEIMLGKLLGVALLTVTAMAPYILLLLVVLLAVLTHGEPETVAGVREAISLKMVIFFPLYLLLGYVFYGCLFIALGSLSESMQDAQTLTLPIMIVLTACVLVVPAGLADPNSTLVTFASWFPLSAPFASIVRLPADPSWWSLIGSALLMAASTVGVAWLATLVFRQGVLSGGGAKAIWGSLKSAVFGAFRRASS